MGKGSTRRPTNEEAFQANYDAIFGKRKTATQIEADIETYGERLRQRLADCQNKATCSEPFCNCEVSPCNPQK